MRTPTTNPGPKAKSPQPKKKKASAKKSPATKPSAKKRPKRPLQSDGTPILARRAKELRAELDQVAEELTHRTAKGARQLLLELRPELRERSRNVYVIELGDAVRNEKQFKEKNDEQLGTGKPCLYVGMTSLTPELRFAKHKAGTKAARFVKKHGMVLRPEFYLALNPMTHGDAVAMEKELARRLRLAGYPTWQN
jgi:predicted GIY-YIG superfamily endonuclease